MSDPLDSSLSEDMFSNLQNFSPLSHDHEQRPRLPQTTLSKDVLESLQKNATTVPQSSDAQQAKTAKPFKHREPRRRYAAAIAQLQSPTPFEAALGVGANKGPQTIAPRAANVQQPIDPRHRLTLVQGSVVVNSKIPVGNPNVTGFKTITAGSTNGVLLVPASLGRMTVKKEIDAAVVEPKVEETADNEALKPKPLTWDNVTHEEDINKELFVRSTGRVKRPMNAFMIWGRRARAEVAKSMAVGSSNGEVSVRMGELWRSMTDGEKQPYYDEARKLATYHTNLFPDYVYKPAEHNKYFGPVANKRAKSVLWKTYCANGTLASPEEGTSAPPRKKSRPPVNEVDRTRSAYWDNFRRYGNVEGVQTAALSDDDLLPLTTSTPSSILQLGTLFNPDSDEDEFPTMVPISRRALPPELAGTALLDNDPFGALSQVRVKDEPMSPEPEMEEPLAEDSPVPVSMIRVKRELEDWSYSVAVRTDNNPDEDEEPGQQPVTVKEEPEVGGSGDATMNVKHEPESEEDDDEDHRKLREEWEDSETEAWNDPPEESSSRTDMKNETESEESSNDYQPPQASDSRWGRRKTKTKTIAATPEFSIACMRCGRGFATSAELVAHMPVHGEYRAEKRHVCLRCSVNFADSYLLKRHQAYCFDEEPYFCDVCTKTFPESHSLMLHKREHSVDIQRSDPYACLHCEAAFRTRHALLRHVRFHTGDKPYCCSLCKETFRSREELWEHKKQAHNNPGGQGQKHGSLTFDCQFCSDEFRDSEALRVHLVTHTGLKPFQCTQCGAQFMKSDQLNDHQETHK